MNEERLNIVLNAIAKGLDCSNCPIEGKCYMDRWADTAQDDCKENFRKYLMGEEIVPREREYIVDVRFIGHKQYTVRARDEHEAEVKAFEMASYRDVEYWEQDYCVE